MNEQDPYQAPGHRAKVVRTVPCAEEGAPTSKSADWTSATPRARGIALATEIRKGPCIPFPRFPMSFPCLKALISLFGCWLLACLPSSAHPMDDSYTWGSHTIAERPVLNDSTVGVADFTLRNSKHPVIAYSTYSPHTLRCVTWKNGRKIDEPVHYFGNEIAGLQMAAAGEKVAMILCLKLAQNHFQLHYSSLGTHGWSAPELVHTASTGIGFDFKLGPDGAPLLAVDHRLHTGYPTADEIRFYERGTSGWAYQIIRPHIQSYSVSKIRLTVTPSGEPHVAWSEYSPNSGGPPPTVHHATREAGVWTRAPLFDGSLAALGNGPGGAPALFAKLHEGASVCSFYQDGEWSTPETLPAWYASWTESIATAPDGTIYAPALNELQIRRDGSWSSQPIPVLQKVLVDESGVPHFFTMTDGLIRYHTRIPSLWQDQQVTPADQSLVTLVDMHVSTTNTLRLFIRDPEVQGGVLMTRSPSGWSRSLLPAPPYVGQSYQEGPDGSLHILAGGIDYYWGSISQVERYYPGIPLDLLNGSGNPSMAVDSANLPHLTFTRYDSSAGQHKAYHAERRNGTWTWEVVGSIGSNDHSAVATGNNGGLYVLAGGGLYKKNGTVWEKLVTIPSAIGVGMVVGDDDTVHGFFQTWNRIMVFTWKDGTYQEEVLDHAVSTHPRARIIMAGGRPLILRAAHIDYEQDIEYLRVAEKFSNYWRQETLLPLALGQEYGENIRIAADQSGKIHVAADRAYRVDHGIYSYIEHHQRDLASPLDLGQSPVLRPSPDGRHEFRLDVPEPGSPLEFQISADLKTWTTVFDFSQAPAPANGSANLEFRGDGFRQELIYRPAANQQACFGRLVEK